MRRTALTIAGSDCSGGAGIQADIKTMMANGVYAMSAVTALTAQNTRKVEAVMTVSPEFLAQQLDCVFTDIFPDAVKTGMMSSGDLIRITARKLREYGAKNIVTDPVMVSTSGSRLLDEEAVQVMREELLVLADLVTPNIPEAEVLSGQKISDEEDMIRAAEIISRSCRTSVLLKGGHRVSDANDLLYFSDEAAAGRRAGQKGNGKEAFLWFQGKRINNPNTHGTGCTLSSAIAANLARGSDLEGAVRKAKRYLENALAAMLDLGKGSGPLDHGFAAGRQ